MRKLPKVPVIRAELLAEAEASINDGKLVHAAACLNDFAWVNGTFHAERPYAWGNVKYAALVMRDAAGKAPGIIAAAVKKARQEMALAVKAMA